MANEDIESVVEGVQGDIDHNHIQADCPVILDGEQEQVEVLKSEVSHKLNSARKTRPWTRRRRYSDDLTILEDQLNHANEDDHDAAADPDKTLKDRLGGLLNTFKSNEDHNNHKHGTARRPAFKPIRLAVARARFVDNNGDANPALPSSAVTDKKTTTLTLPGGQDGAAFTEVGALNEEGTAVNDDDDDDARSYVDIPRAPSPTATYSSTSSSPNTTPDNESGIFQWLRKPNSRHNLTSPISTTSDLPPAEAGPSSSGSTTAYDATTNTTTTRKWKAPRTKKSSKASSQGDIPESPQAIDYAEIDTMKPRQRPKRSDTLLRGMMPGRSESYGYKRNNSLRLPKSFRGGRRRRRKGKGREGDDDGSSSEEAMDDEEMFHETLRKAGLFDRDVPEQMVVELLWQNERGLYLLGTRYGKNALLPGDPGAWTDIHGQSTSYNTTSFPLPTPAWRWHHAEWLISMIGDVDSEGYQYSTRFSSKYWRGIPEIRFFVRRRLWIRARYRPSLKAQKIAEFTHPQSGIKGTHFTMPRSGSRDTANAVLTSHISANQEDTLFSPMLASRLDPRNPFVSYYALKQGRSRDLGDSSSSAGKPSIPKKQDVIHANFIRAAKVLLRRTNVDRERLAWVEYWLGSREDALHVTDVSGSLHFTNAVHVDDVQNTGKSHQAGSLADIEEKHVERPDIRDIWDLVEDRLDDILGLFEYQETRRELLLLLRQLHNSSHPEHHYKNRSSSPDHPSELLPRHEHGTTDELGASAEARAANGDGTHRRAEEVPRLAFWSDLEERLTGLQVSASPSSGKATTKR